MKPFFLSFLSLCVGFGGILGCGDADDGSIQKKDANESIGSSSVDIDTRVVTTYVGEAAVGTFFADIYRDEIEALGYSVDAATINAGAIRGGPFDEESGEFIPSRSGTVYDAGELTAGHVASWFPFPGPTVVAQMSGHQLKSALERGVSSLPPAAPEEGGWFLQVSGLSYAVDCGGNAQQLSADGKSIELAGTRISKIQIGDTVVYDVAEGVDVLGSTTLGLAAPAFVAAGSDGHLAFTEVAEANWESIPMSEFDLVEAVTEYIKHNSPIAPQKDGRISINGDCGRAIDP